MSAEKNVSKTEYSQNKSVLFDLKGVRMMVFRFLDQLTKF